MHKSLLLIFSLIFSLKLCAQQFEITPGIEKAYDAAISLRLEEAKEILAELEETEAQNLIRLHIENYVDFFTIFLNEDKKEFDRLKKNKKKRLKQIEKYGDKNSPYFLFVQAEIELQWALARAKFEEFFTASGEVYSAYKMLKANQKKHPDFIANKKSLGVIHTVVESIPGVIKFIFSIDGSISQGTQEIKEVLDYSKENDFLYEQEVVAMYAYILYYQNNKKSEAWQFIIDSELDEKSSPLACFLKATFAQKMGLNEQALSILRGRPKGKEYTPFHYLDFMEGRSLLTKLDPNANVPIEKFIANFKGRHYIKEAYQKLAWHEMIINNNLAGYKKYMKLCQDRGEDLIDEDKQALKEAKRNEPNFHTELLKARLLFDGGYYQKSYNLLVRQSHLFQYDRNLGMEFHYRLGRVTHALLNLPDAITHYEKAINLGKDSDSYFPCNAALQIGLIFENQQNYKEAKIYFKKCLEFKPKEYKNSLHQKAKSGLARIKN